MNGKAEGKISSKEYFKHKKIIYCPSSTLSPQYSTCTEKVREVAGNGKPGQRWVHARVQSMGLVGSCGGERVWPRPGAVRGQSGAPPRFQNIFSLGRENPNRAAEQSCSREASRPGMSFWGSF